MLLLKKLNISHVYLIVIAILALLLFTDSCCSDVVISEETTIETEIVTEVDSSSNQQIKNKTPETVNVVEHKDSTQIIPKEKMHEQDPERVKQVNRYRDTTYFENAVVYSDILSEGRVLKLDLKTSIDHLRTTITETKTIQKNPSGFYLKPSVEFVPGLLNSVATEVLFIKGRFGGSAGVAYAFQDPVRHFRFRVGLLIKL